ncbi:MAG TPA: hypothetical protein VMW10_11155 [Alphaproteobacteria bacterium]|nr:hypothetical protein [Alphaproteobacteria bacterium]
MSNKLEDTWIALEPTLLAKHVLLKTGNERRTLPTVVFASPQRGRDDLKTTHF